MKNITLFKNIHETSTPYYISIDTVFNRIKEGKSKELVEKIRGCEDKRVRNELKKGLPSICFSGMFSERKASKINKHSGFICIDFDDFKTKEELQCFKKTIIDDEYTYACFISPSGNGIKLIIKIPPEPHNHKRYFDAIKDHYNSPHFDIAGSDISRVCYESYDPSIFINKNAKLFDKVIDTVEYLNHDVKNIKIPLKHENEIVKRLEKWWQKKYSFNKGSRNETVFKIACAFCDFGVSQYTCEQYLQNYKDNDFTIKEINRTIQSAYEKSNWNSKYFEDTQVVNHVVSRIISGHSEEIINKELKSKGYTELEIESVFEDAKKSEPIEVFWQKLKNGNIKIISLKFKNYLKQKGFYKYYPEGSDNFVFVKIESNLIENITEEKIKSFVLDELISNSMFDVYEYLTINTKYFKEDFLNILDQINVFMKKDTEKKAYCYFKNCAVEITHNEINIIDYLSLDGYVWRDQIIERDFEIKTNYENDFKKFVYNIAGRNDLNAKSFESTIGYLAHSYKNKAYSPAIILNDEVISESPEGGTGKGLFVNAISRFKRCATIDGKSFDKNKNFAYQTVPASTQVLIFDDVKKNFDFEGLFSLITEGITLEKKNKDAIKLDFYASPKVIITTNYAISGKGNSHDRRRWELELAQHYNSQNTPLKEFGKLLFDQWDADEWLKFDNYMIRCVQKHLESGFVTADFKNIKTRKFINETCYEFYEWVEDAENIDLFKQERISKNMLLNEFTSIFSDYKKWLSQKKFNLWLRSWAEYKEIKYEEGNSNGVRWITYDLGLKPNDDFIF